MNAERDELPRGRSRRRGVGALATLSASALGLFVAGALVVTQGRAQDEAAEPREMSIEELERFIEEQKQALEIVRENRDITAEKAREVREALAEKEAEREAAEGEFETLCEEREALEPGTLEDCLAQRDG